MISNITSTAGNVSNLSNEHDTVSSAENTSSDGLSQDDMEKFMIQLMQTYSILKDPDAPDAAPTMNTDWGF